MFVLHYIDTFWFLIALCIGLLIVYTTSPTPDIIIKYPTPENAHMLVFEDDAQNCYKFSTNETPCPVNGTVHEIPITRKTSIN